MKTFNNLFPIVLVILTLSLLQTANATVWRVNNNVAFSQWTNQQVFNDVNAAISSASVSPGDTLYIEASATNYGIVTINKRLVLIGTGYYLDGNAGQQDNQIAATIQKIVLTEGANGSVIMGLTIAGNVNNGGITFGDNSISNITITRCRIERSIYFGNGEEITLNNIVITKNVLYSLDYNVNNYGPVTGLIVTNNSFESQVYLAPNYYGVMAHNILKNGVRFYSGVDFYNNIILAGTILQNNNSSTNVYYNLFSVAQPVWLTGGNNDFGVPSSTIFPTIGSNDAKLKPNPSNICPQCYKGFPGGTAEIGMFGGNDPYILSGIPAIPTIYNLQAPANILQGEMIDIYISTRSNK